MLHDRPPHHEDVARLAYELYLERGARPGHALRDWLDAEAELSGALLERDDQLLSPSPRDVVAEASWESFPASDAPGWRYGSTSPHAR